MLFFRRQQENFQKGSEWRVASGEWFFLEGSALALPKISSTSVDAPFSFVNLWRVGQEPDRKNFNTAEAVPSSLVEDSCRAFNAKILCGQVEKVVSGVA